MMIWLYVYLFMHGVSYKCTDGCLDFPVIKNRLTVNCIQIWHSSIFISHHK